MKKVNNRGAWSYEYENRQENIEGEKREMEFQKSQNNERAVRFHQNNIEFLESITDELWNSYH